MVSRKTFNPVYQMLLQLILLPHLKLSPDIILLSKRPTKTVLYPNCVRKTLKRVLFVVWLLIYCTIVTIFLNSFCLQGVGRYVQNASVFRIISYNTCNRADNQSIKLKIMCNYIINQRAYVYLVKTRALSRKIGNWLESGCLKRLVSEFFSFFQANSNPAG